MSNSNQAPVSLPIPINRVLPNPEQPRTEFDQDALRELAETIKVHGVMEPIIVEKYEDDYILHDGERRTRAARLAGLDTIPAIVHPSLNGTGPKTRLIKAMVANVQRADMTPLDEARAYKRMRDEFGMTIAEIGRSIGKNTNLIGQRLILNELEPEIQALVAQGLLPHFVDAVRAMLSLPAGAVRIKFCSALANRKPTIKIVVQACNKYLLALEEQKKKSALSESGPLESPAVQIARQHVELKLPEWDVWQQLGALPPWTVVREAGTATCNACAIRPVASVANCKDCPAVECIKRMMEISHAPVKRKR